VKPRNVVLIIVPFFRFVTRYSLV